MIQSNTSRLDAIFLPISEEFVIYGQVYHNTHVYKTPIFSMDSESIIVELCGQAKTMLEQDDPILFRDDVNSCTNYFCGITQPEYLSKSLNTNYTIYQRRNYTDYHILVHRYCLQCSNSNQNFTNTSCPWVNRDYFENRCDSNSLGNAIPIYYNSVLPICFDMTKNVFLGRNDFNHHVLLQFYLFWNSLILMILYIIAWVYLVFLLVIPSIAEMFRVCRRSLNVPTPPREKMSYLFNFYHAYILVWSCSFTQSIVLTLLDVLGFYIKFDGRFRNIAMLLNISAVLIVFLILVIQWIYIYLKSQRMGNKIFTVKAL